MSNKIEILKKERATLISDVELELTAKREAGVDSPENDPGIKAKLDRANSIEVELREAEINERTAENTKLYREEVEAYFGTFAEERDDKDLPPTFMDQAKLAAKKIPEHFSRNIDLTLNQSYDILKKRGIGAEAFMKLSKTPEGKQEIRNLVVGTDSEGGYLVPDTFSNSLYEGLVSNQGLRSAGASVINVQSSQVHRIPTLSTPYNTVQTTATAEGAQVAATEDGFGEKTLGSHKFTSRMDITKELLADNVVGLDSLIGRRLGEIIGNSIENNYTKGDGSDAPAGILNAVPANRTITDDYVASGTGATSGVSFESLVEALGDLDPLYTQGSGMTWMMHPSVFYGIIGQTDANNRPIHAVRTAETPQNTILGIPVSFNSHMDQYGADQDLIVVGDISRAYIIRDNGSMDVSSSSEFLFDTQQIAFIADFRTDACVLDQNAFRLIKSGS